MIIKKLVLAFVLLGSAQGHAQIGIDINSAIIGCIMSGGTCLSNTGIPIVDLFFGGGSTPHHNEESFCYAWLENWCSGPVSYPSAYENCRDAKKQFYKKAKMQIGEWPSSQDLNNKYQHLFSNHRPREELYLEEIEEKLNQRSKPRYFTCTARQQYIWLKNMCGRTQQYSKYRHGVEYKDHSPEVWARIGTNGCGGG